MIGRPHGYKKSSGKRGPLSFSFLEKILPVSTVFTMIMSVPQILTIWQSHSANGVSLISWISYLLSACLWFVHGLQKKDKRIYLECIGWIVIDVAILIGIFIFS